MNESDADTFFTQYQARLAGGNLSPDSQREYSRRIKGFLQFARACNVPLSMQEAVDLYFEQRSKVPGASVYTIRSLRSAIQSLSDVLELGLVMPQVRQSAMPPPRVLTMPELTAYLRGADLYASKRDRALVYIIASTGMRMHKIRELRVSDGSYVCNSITSSACELHSLPGLVQTAHSAVVDFLQDQLQAHDDVDRVLFSTQSGRKLSRHAADLIVRKIGWKAKLFVNGEILRNSYWSIALSSAQTTNERQRHLSSARRKSLISATTLIWMDNQ